MGAAAGKSKSKSPTAGTGGAGVGVAPVKAPTKIKTKNVKKKPSSASGLHDNGWSSPYRFRELWDVETQALCLNEDAHSPSTTLRLQAENDMRESMNELFFGIATNTLWKQQQVRGLFAVYKKCCLLTEDRVLNYSAFCLHFFPLSSNHHFPPRVIHKIYHTIFDADEDGLLSFIDFIQGISRCIHGQRRHKMRIVFDMFDVDNDGYWSFDEAGNFLRTSMLYVKHLTLDSIEEIDMYDMLQEEQFEWWRSELQAMQQAMGDQEPPFASPTSSQQVASAIPTSSPQSIQSAASTRIVSPASSSRLISFSSFQRWSSRLFRFRPFLSRFDVLPTPHAESTLIHSLWSTDDASGLELGATWYVMSESWWRSWKAYSGFKEPGEDEEEEDGEEAARGGGGAEEDEQEQTTNNTRTSRRKKPNKKTLPSHTNSELLSPPYLISDTDSDSYDDPPVRPDSLPPPSTPPHGPSRTSSILHRTPAQSPNGIHINGINDRKTMMTNNNNATTMNSPSPSPTSTQAKSSRPTAIDNSDLTSRTNPLLLRDNLVEHEDFVLLSSSVWSQLVEWYGLVSSHSCFPRSVIEVGLAGARMKRIELYPLCLRIYRVGKEAPKPIGCARVPIQGTPIFINDMSHTTVTMLEQRLGKLFFFQDDSNESSSSSSKVLTKRTKTFGSSKKWNGKEKDPSGSPSASSPSAATSPYIGGADDLLPRSMRLWLRDGNDYRCLLLDDSNKNLEELDLQSDDPILVELERPGKTNASGAPSWYMDRRKPVKPWTEFQVGATIDARDKQAIWYTSIIRAIEKTTDTGTTIGTSGVKEDMLLVHFIGWSEKWNERIPISSICRCRGPCSCTGRLALAGSQVRFKRVEATSGTVGRDGLSPVDAAGGIGANANTGGDTKGLCGLQNLGNTCFMSSIIQCLSHTPYLVQNYFLAGKYVSELNKTNPLGHKGLLALEFGHLIKELWSGTYRVYAPIKFKRVLSDFAPSFDGYQQHDSHELLAFLLDGLHEDLNRVIKKVPTQAVESNGRNDAIVVSEAWHTFKLRNMSVITDLFHGMLKSTVICPETTCRRVSVTFDTFRYLTLPIPQYHERQFIVTLCRTTSPDPLVNYGIILPDHATVGQLKEKLSQLCRLPVHKLLLCDVHKCKLYRVLMDSKRVSSIRDQEVLVAYEMLPDAFKDPTAPQIQIHTPTPTNPSGGQSEDNSSTSTSSSSSLSASSGSSSSSAPVAVRDSLIYLQAIHKYIMVDSHGNQSMSPRFGIPVCLTTTPHIPNRRIHQLVAAAIERWTPATPGRTRHAHSDSYSELPYTVRMVDHTCSRCGVCPESSNCGGCCLPDDDRACGLDGSFALCILWETDLTARQVKLAMDDSRIIDDPSLSLKARNGASPSGLSLSACIDLFSSLETLSKEDAWFCSRCKEFRQATKQIQLYQTPEILIIHLKRFLQINRIRREKQTAMVDFPLKGLDLTPFIPAHALENEPQPIYDLFAVSNHLGGLSGGHYTSFCLHQSTQRWYLFDDSKVSEVTHEQIKTPYAYVLMYKRRG